MSPIAGVRGGAIFKLPKGILDDPLLLARKPFVERLGVLLCDRTLLRVTVIVTCLDDELPLSLKLSENTVAARWSGALRHIDVVGPCD